MNPVRNNNYMESKNMLNITHKKSSTAQAVIHDCLKTICF